jgi:hypothetical protein
MPDQSVQRTFNQPVANEAVETADDYTEFDPLGSKLSLDNLGHKVSRNGSIRTNARLNRHAQQNWFSAGNPG